MTYKEPSSGKRKFRGLGRLETDEAVINALVVAYRQIDPAAIQEDGSNVKTIGDLLRAWYFWQEQRGPGSGTRQESQIAERTLVVYRISSRQLRKHGKDIPLRRISKQDLLTLRDAMSQEYAPRTVNLAFKCLRQAWIWGTERGVELPVFDWRTLRLRVREYTNRHRTPTHEEVEQLYTSLRRCPLKLALLIAWRTGARVGEVCSLVWSDIYEDEDGAWVTLRGKTGERRFPLTAEDVAEIRSFQPRHSSGEGRLFASARKNSSGQLVISCELRSIEPFTFHGLRRLMTDTCQRRGVDIGAYTALLGHSPEEALRAYRQPTVDDLRGALVKIRNRGQESLHPFLDRHGMTEEQALSILQSYLDSSEPVPGTRLRVVRASGRAAGGS